MISPSRIRPRHCDIPRSPRKQIGDGDRGQRRHAIPLPSPYGAIGHVEHFGE